MSYPLHDAPASAATALASLPGWLAAWFRARYGEPTEAQRLAWPLLAGGEPREGEAPAEPRASSAPDRVQGEGPGNSGSAGASPSRAGASPSRPGTSPSRPGTSPSRPRHVLISAPTGTGKTLAALAPILATLDGGLRLLVVAPLKALVNDAARNLARDLDDLAECVPDRPTPRVGVRTGDTPPEERQRQRDDPPDVLFTTPESLAVMLTRPDSTALFAGLRWVVVDEVHAFAGTKRGADLALSLERVCALTRNVRRVGLSATATPLEQAARFLSGGGDCAVVRAGLVTPPELRLEPLPDGERFLTAVVRRLAEEVPRHRSTLVFTNTRGLCERLAWALRRHAPALDGRIAVHHSALSARRRRETEARLKRGELAAVVSSTSLELGIDVGGVDLAVLVHPPGDVIRLLQRVGRAGHDPAGVRRGLVLTATAAELLEAAVTLASARSGQCEPLPSAGPPLDVLCQHLLAACCLGSCEADELFNLVRGAAPYADLSRDDFDACMSYLRGVDSRGRSWLPARLRPDGDLWRVRDNRTVQLLRRNLGTILTDRTVPVSLRANEALTPLGELDEAFAERLTPGDRFLLDGRCLEFRALIGGAAVVEEVPGRPRVPRWGGDGWPLSAELANRLYLLRTLAADALREGEAALRTLLERDYGLSGEAVELLAAYFQQQEAASEVPDATTLLIEGVNVGIDTEFYVHTPLNRTGNDALARVALRRLGRRASSQVADLGFLLKVEGDDPDPAALLRRLLDAECFAEDHAAALATSEAVRLRFGRVATTGLMVLRNPIGRTPKVGGEGWAGRELFDRLRRREAGFVLLRQAAREAADEVSDVAAALAYVRRLPALTVRVRRLPRTSPFASAWTQQEAGPSEEALSPAEALKRLHAELTGGG